MKLPLQNGIVGFVCCLLLAIAGMAGAAGPEDNFPPGGQFPALWSTAPGAKAGFAVASDTANGGTFSLKSLTVVEDQFASSTTRNLAATQVAGTWSAGTISFAYQVSSEAPYDKLEFWIDETLKLEVSGNVGWTTVSYPVTAGQHVFKWVYNKDNSQTAGSDAAWIDTVVLPSGTLQPPLNVTRTGRGSGTVTSNPAGIVCGGLCTATYNPGASVVLTAAAGAGSVFSNWSGDCSGTGATCTVSMTAARNVVANFGLPDDNFPLNGQMPAGWTKPATHPALPDIAVTNAFTVANDATYRGAFSLKSGTITHSQYSGIQFTATVGAGNIDFTYRVSSETFADNIQFYIDGLFQDLEAPVSGEVDWTTTSVPVTAGTHVFTFIYGKDDTNSSGSDAVWIDSLVLPGASTRLLTVTGAGAGAGTVTSNPAGINCGATCSTAFAPDTVVTLTATPANGSTFAGWFGACTETATTCQVTMNVAKDVTASFALAGNPTSTLTVVKAGNGSGTVTSNPAGINCGVTCSAPFTTSSVVTLTASPVSGSTFTGWSGACSGSATTCLVTMDFAKSVTGTFILSAAPSQLTVSKAGAGSGTVTSNPAAIDCGATCSASFLSNITVTLTASAAAGSTFSGWSGACSGSATTCQVLMDSAKTAIATFSLTGSPTQLLTVTRTGTGSGTVTSNPAGINCGATCAATFTTNSIATLTATLTSGSVFSGWSGACSGTSTTCQVTMDASKTANAVFSLPSTGNTLDIDASSPGSKYDALTDGLMIARYLFGLTGTALTKSALGATATRTDPVAIKAYLDGMRPSLDVDGNGQSDALTDGLLLLRYLFGLRGTALINGVIGPNATRTTAPAIEGYIIGLMP